MSKSDIDTSVGGNTQLLEAKSALLREALLRLVQQEPDEPCGCVLPRNGLISANKFNEIGGVKHLSGILKGVSSPVNALHHHRVVAKQRNCPTGRVELAFRLELARFEDYVPVPAWLWVINLANWLDNQTRIIHNWRRHVMRPILERA